MYRTKCLNTVRTQLSFTASSFIFIISSFKRIAGSVSSAISKMMSRIVILTVASVLCMVSAASVSGVADHTSPVEAGPTSISSVLSLTAIATRQVDQCPSRFFDQFSSCLCWAIFKNLVITALPVGNRRKFAKECAIGLGKTYVGQLQKFCRPFRGGLGFNCKTAAGKINRASKKCLGSLGKLKPKC